MRLAILLFLSGLGSAVGATPPVSSCRIFLTVTLQSEDGPSTMIAVEKFKTKVAEAPRSELIGSSHNQVVVATEDVSEVIELSEGFALEKVELMGRTVPLYSSPISPQSLPHLRHQGVFNPREALFQALYLLPEGFYKLTDSHGGAFQLEFFYDKQSGQEPSLHARLSSGFFLLPRSEQALHRLTLADFSTQPGLEDGKSVVIRENVISFVDPLQETGSSGALNFVYDEAGALSEIQAGPLKFEVQAFYPYSRATQGFKIAPKSP